MRKGWRSWRACTVGQAEPFRDTSGALHRLASGCTSANRIWSERPRLARRNFPDVKSIRDIKANAAEVLALGQRDIAAGRTRPVADVGSGLRAMNGLNKVVAA